MKSSLKKLKVKYEEIENSRKSLLKILFSDLQLVEGSYINVLVKCGRPGCHCKKKPIHPITKLSWWEGTNLKNKIVRVADREWVKMLSDNYKAHKQALSKLVKMNSQEKEIIKEIIKLKVVKYK